MPEQNVDALAREARKFLGLLSPAQWWAESVLRGSKSGLTLRQFHALDILDVGGEMTVGELGRRLHVAPAVATGMTRRLESLQWVSSKKGGTTDRRQVIVKITPFGKAVLDQTSMRLGRALAERPEYQSEGPYAFRLILGTLGEVVSNLPQEDKRPGKR